MGGFNLDSLFGGLGGLGPTPPFVGGLPSGVGNIPPWILGTPPTAPPPQGPTTLGLSNSTWTNILKAVGLSSSVLGSILNRPKGLSKEQQRALDMLMSNLSAQANAPLTINPQDRNEIGRASCRERVYVLV